MRHAPWSIALALVLAGHAPGCSDPVSHPAAGSVTLESSSATVDIDRTYPTDQALVQLDVAVHYEAADPAVFGGDYPATLTALRLRAVGGDASVDLGTGTLQPLGDGVGVSAGQTTTLYYYPAASATTAALAPLCDAAAVEVEIGVRVEDCDCEGTLTVPAVLTCDEDRRADAELALTSAGLPVGMPCERSDDATSFTEEYGYDADGRLLLRDVASQFGAEVRFVYAYDTQGRLASHQEITTQTRERSSTTTYTRDAAGRLTRTDTRRAAPPYETGSSTYSYEAGDDRGWTRRDAQGRETQSARWDDAADALVIRDTEPIHNAVTVTTVTFGSTFAREAWLGVPDVVALDATQPTSLVSESAGGERSAERVLVWEDGRITSDVTTVTTASGSGTNTVTWGYTCP